MASFVGGFFHLCTQRLRLNTLVRQRLYHLILVATLWMGSASGVLGVSPGEIDSSFLPPYPAQRGILRKDGTLVIAGRSRVTVIQRDGSLVLGPFEVPVEPAVPPMFMSLMRDGTVVGAFDPSRFPELNPTGLLFTLTPDGTFQTLRLGGLGSGKTARAVLGLPDGRIAIAGTLANDTLQGAGEDIGILDASLSLDSSTILKCRGGRLSRTGQVRGLSLLQDGSYLAYGYFSTVNGERRNGIARLLPNGQLAGPVSASIGANSAIWGAVQQRDGKIVVGGWLATPHMGVVAMVRLLPDGTLDPAFTPATSADLGEIVPIRSVALDQRDRIIVSGVFEKLSGMTLPGVARLLPDGTVDASFRFQGGGPRIFSYGGPDYPDYWADDLGDVYGFGAASEGPLVGQETVRLRGGDRSLHAPKLVMNSQTIAVTVGSPTQMFVPIDAEPPADIQWFLNGSPIPNATNAAYQVYAAVVQDTGSYRVTASNYLGTVDRQVALVRVSDAFGGVGPQVENPYRWPSTEWYSRGSTFTELADGKLAVAFSSRVGTTPTDTGELVHGIRRHARDGHVDSDFWVTLELDGTTNLVCSLVGLPDGKLLAAGNFIKVNGQPRRSVVRLLSNGSIDPSFVDLGDTTGTVRCMTVMSDGRIVMGGNFTSIQGTKTGPLAILTRSGALDASVHPVGFEDGESVTSVHILPGDGVLARVIRPPTGGAPSMRLLNLSILDGSAKTLFVPSLDSSNLLAAVSADGSIFVASTIATNTPLAQILSLRQDGTTNPAFASALVLPGKVVGLAPDEVGGVWVAASDRFRLPAMGNPMLVKVAGDGQLEPKSGFLFPTAVGFPANPPLALSRSGEVLVSSSSGIYRNFDFRSYEGPPRPLGVLGDQDLETTSGSLANGGSIFHAAVQGGGMGFQWFGGGEFLSGEPRASLIVSADRLFRIGGFHYVATNAFGSYTSRAARVHPVPGLARLQMRPVSSVGFGQNVGISSAVSGTPPLRVQWYRNEVLLPNQQNQNLWLPAFSASDVGYYRAVVSNAAGEVATDLVSLDLTNRVLHISDAVDTPGAVWVGHGLWASESTDTSDSVDAAVLTPTPELRYGDCSLLLFGSGRLEFQWKSDLQAPGFSYRLLQDGKAIQPVPLTSPTAEWTHQSVPVPLGAHLFTWAYEWPQGTATARAYLDQVRYTPDLALPPVILAQPVPAILFEGQPLVLGVGIHSLEPASYLWRKNGKPIPGETNQRLQIVSVSPESAGDYDVVVSNGKGSVTSQIAAVVVYGVSKELSVPRPDTLARPTFVVSLSVLQNVQLQSSEDLEHWINVPVWTQTRIDLGVDLYDLSPVDGGQRFYRLIPVR